VTVMAREVSEPTRKTIDAVSRIKSARLIGGPVHMARDVEVFLGRPRNPRGTVSDAAPYTPIDSPRARGCASPSA